MEVDFVEESEWVAQMLSCFACGFDKNVDFGEVYMIVCQYIEDNDITNDNMLKLGKLVRLNKMKGLKQ